MNTLVGLQWPGLCTRVGRRSKVRVRLVRVEERLDLTLEISLGLSLQELGDGVVMVLQRQKRPKRKSMARVKSALVSWTSPQLEVVNSQ